MTRHNDPGFDPRIADWLEADPDHAPSEVMRTVESALPSIPQRRVLRLPWRNLSMNKLVPIGATILLLAALGVGAVAVGSRPSTTTPTPAPTAPSAVEAPTAPAVSVADFTSSRDEICSAAGVKAAPVKDRVNLLYDSKATDAQKADAIAAVRDYLALATTYVAELAALDAPPEMLAGHVAVVANYKDILILIGESLALHDAGKTAEAIAVDLATNGIAAQIDAYESRLGLTPCP